jgi:hypothetical protein
MHHCGAMPPAQITYSSGPECASAQTSGTGVVYFSGPTWFCP